MLRVWDSFQQRLGVIVVGVVKYLDARPTLDNLARIEHRHGVGHPRNQAQVMRDVEG